MNRNYNDQPNGYTETIEAGIETVRRFRPGLSRGKGSREEQMERLRTALREADAVVLGAGAGLSTAAGFTYSGERFERWFHDFAARFGIRDMYSGGFYPFPDAETRWAWWARHIYYNRYIDPSRPVYQTLRELLEGKDYFVITTNVDHQFQRAGFDKKRLFYTQGDYGLFQSRDGKDRNTYDNEAWVMEAMEAMGFVRDEAGIFQIPEGKTVSMRLPPELIPRIPGTGAEVSMNLRADDSFVEDAGWQKASAAYGEFLRRHQGLRLLFWEIGVGNNTPVIIKYPFWAMTARNPKAIYVCMNYDEAYCPRAIEEQSLCLDGDAGELLERLSRE